MLFSLDEDVGERVVCWVMPDNPAAVPRVVVHLDSDRRVVVEASVYRPLLKQQGLHNSGICGFVIDERSCPGIGKAPGLAIYDADQNVLVYRRRPARRMVERRFLRLETQLLRLTALDDVLGPHFQLTYGALETVPEETVMSIFAITYSESIHASGRVFVRPWEPQLRDREFKIAALLRDPFEELAERLLVLQWVSTRQGAEHGRTLSPLLEPASRAFHGITLTDQEALGARLANLDDNARNLLYNPLTYQLTARNAYDPPASPATAAALETLADFDAVGLRSTLPAFMATLEAVLDTPEPLEVPTIPTSRTVADFATMLRSMDRARALIEMDLEVFKIASGAVAMAAPPGGSSA